MRKFLFAPILAVVMVATVVLGATLLLKPEPAIQPVAIATSCDQVSLLGLVCARQSGNQLIVSIAGSDVAWLPLSSVVSIPTVRVSVPETIRVTLPRVTVTRPPVTVTLPGQIVTLPRQTVTVELPRATTTASIQLPGQTTTVSGQSVTQAPTVVPVTVTAPNGQKIQTSVTITASPLPGTVTTKPVTKEKEVRVSVPQAIAYGIGALLLGLVLGLLAIYAAYAVGYKDSEDAERTAWGHFRDEVFGKKDEGDK